MNWKNMAYFGKMHMRHKRKFFFLSSLMMLVGMAVSFRVMYIYYSANYNIIQVRHLFKNSWNSMYKIENSYFNFDDVDYFERYRDVLIELKENYDIAVYENLNMYPGELADKVMPFIKDGFTERELLYSGGYVPMLYMDNSLIAAAGIRGEDGKILALRTDADGVMEVAAGPFYRDVLEIGDTFEYVTRAQPSVTYKFRIAYFLADGQKWLDGKMDEYSEIITLDKYFVAPMALEKHTAGYYLNYLNNVYFFAGRDAGNEASQIEEYMRAMDMRQFSVLSVRDYMDKRQRNSSELKLFGVVLALLMFVVTLSCTVILSIITWLADCRDIGILYTNGFGPRDILRLILYENIIKLAVPMIATGLYAWVISLTEGFVIARAYIAEIYLLICVVYFAAAVLCSVGSYVYIKKQTPSGLLKGETL